MITVALSAASTRLGWDLDSVSTPMVTALGDVTTLPSLFLATFLLGHGSITATIASRPSASALVCIAIAGTARTTGCVRKIIWEMTATILLTPILDVLAGQLQQARLAELAAVPALIAVIPPFVSQAGALGGIFSSRITSKMQLGVITPRGRPEIPARRRRHHRGRARRSSCSCSIGVDRWAARRSRRGCRTSPARRR